MKTPALARVQPPRGPWAQGPMAVGLRQVGRLIVEHLRAGLQPVEPLGVEQVCFIIVKSRVQNQQKNIIKK